MKDWLYKSIRYEHYIERRILFVKIIKDSYIYGVSKILFLGIPIYQVSFATGVPKGIFLGIFKFNLSPRVILKKMLYSLKCKGELNGIDRVIFLFNNSGETSLLLSSLNEEVSLKDRTLLVPTAPYHLQIMEMFTTCFKWVVGYHMRWIHLVWPEECLRFQAYGVTCYGTSLSYFKRYERETNESKLDDVAHFYKRYIENQTPSGVCVNWIPKIYPYQRANVIELMKHQGLTGKHYVVINTESVSNEMISDDFWIELSKRIRNRGYEVVFSGLKSTRAHIYMKSFYTTFAESILIAARADAVIGVRSGYFDMIYRTSRKLIVLYTPFKDRGAFPRMDAQRVKACFTLSKLPYVRNKNIKEILLEDFTNFNSENLIREIIKDLPSVLKF